MWADNAGSVIAAAARFLICNPRDKIKHFLRFTLLRLGDKVISPAGVSSHVKQENISFILENP